MSAEIVNLRLARKTRARAVHDANGAANRAKHGRSRDEREATRRETEVASRRHEGHRLDPVVDPGDGAA